MANLRYRIERLGRHHDRSVFSCGEDALDSYLRRRARRDDERHVARVFVLTEPGAGRIVGYYTLSASAVHLLSLPPELQRKLPKYPLAPVILLGRLAIDRGYHGQGLGEALLFNALRRAFDAGTTEIAAMAVTVDALHERARLFYERYGFQQFLDNEYRLFLPMETIARLLAEAD